MGLLGWPWCCYGGHGVAVVAMTLSGVAVVAMALPGVAVVVMVLLW